MKDNFEKLMVWQKSVELVTLLYSVTKSFPKEEIYGLTSQIRRCSISIPSNIAEGSAKFSKNEFARFVSIALGSTAELKTQIFIAKNLNFITEPVFQAIISKLNEIHPMLHKLLKSLKLVTNNQ